MPIFEFRCVGCGEIFEKLFMGSDNEVDLSCPNCKSATVERVVSRANYAVGPGPGGKQPKITSRACGGGNECMTLDLPGHSR